MYHPGGETPEFGGAVIIHANPVQVKAGKIVRLPIVLPCVLEVADGFTTIISVMCITGEDKVLPATREMRILAIETAFTLIA